MRTAADAAGGALVASLSPFAIDMILPVLLNSLDLKVLWQSKVAAMSLLVALSKQAPDAVKLNLPTIVPVLSYCVSDAKRQVKVRVFAQKGASTLCAHLSICTSAPPCHQLFWCLNHVWCSCLAY